MNNAEILKNKLEELLNRRPLDIGKMNEVAIQFLTTVMGEYDLRDLLIELNRGEYDDEDQARALGEKIVRCLEQLLKEVP